MERGWGGVIHSADSFLSVCYDPACLTPLHPAPHPCMLLRAEILVKSACRPLSTCGAGHAGDLWRLAVRTLQRQLARKEVEDAGQGWRVHLRETPGDPRTSDCWAMGWGWPVAFSGPPPLGFFLPRGQQVPWCQAQYGEGPLGPGCHPCMQRGCRQTGSFGGFPSSVQWRHDIGRALSNIILFKPHNWPIRKVFLISPILQMAKLRREMSRSLGQTCRIGFQAGEGPS